MKAWSGEEERLYKDLLYTTNLYLGGEQIYPYWEAVYALLTGAFLTVYFTQSLGLLERLALCAIGLLFAVNWRRLDGRNREYADSREKRMNKLMEALQTQVTIGKGKETLCVTTFDLPADQRRDLCERRTFWNRRSTWALRLDISTHLIVIWILLVLYSLVPEVVGWLN